MIKKLLICFLFLYSSAVFAQSDFIMNYDVIDIVPSDKIPSYVTLTNDKNAEILLFENGLKSHRHSLGIDFGTTLFITTTRPILFSLPFQIVKNAKQQNFEGKFGFRLTYTYRIMNKMELDIDLGNYIASSFMTNITNPKFTETYSIPLSVGMRFYFNKRNRASGFFLMPKVGATINIDKTKEYSTNEAGIVNKINKDRIYFDAYIAGEMGFRIDLSRSMGIDTGVRPFIDISLLDIGLSYTYLIRFIPLPRIAVGVLF